MLMLGIYSEVYYDVVDCDVTKAYDFKRFEINLFHVIYHTLLHVLVPVTKMNVNYSYHTYML